MRKMTIFRFISSTWGAYPSACCRCECARMAGRNPRESGSFRWAADAETVEAARRHPCACAGACAKSEGEVAVAGGESAVAKRGRATAGLPLE